MKKISGIVQKGKGKGKSLGFPTANIELQKPIESGVYLGYAYISDVKYKAAIFVSQNEKLLEAHIIKLDDDLYGKMMEVEIGERIRNVISFESEKELKKQIEKDVAIISKF